MAVTTNVYNHTMALVAGQSIDKANLKLMLLTSSAGFTASHTTVDSVAGAGPTRANEFYGNGWTQGGVTLGSVAASTITTNDAKFTAAQVSVTATGGDIGPARYALLYDATSMKPLFLYDFGQDEHAGATTPFKATFDLTGGTDAIFVLNV